MATTFNWEEGLILPMNVWADVWNFDNDMVWSKYKFTEEAAGYTWNNALAIRLLITRCNYLEGLITELGTPEEYELTAEKICEAWAIEDFKGRGITIAFIDRMRQLIWNEPFSVQWAARPET